MFFKLCVLHLYGLQTVRFADCRYYGPESTFIQSIGSNLKEFIYELSTEIENTFVDKEDLENIKLSKVKMGAREQMLMLARELSCL